jgi:molybdopterin-binding protein
MKLSARNQIPARVTSIHAGEAIANVELDVGGVRLVASITVEAVRQLGLAEGSPGPLRRLPGETCTRASRLSVNLSRCDARPPISAAVALQSPRADVSDQGSRSAARGQL